MSDLPRPHGRKKSFGPSARRGNFPTARRSYMHHSCRLPSRSLTLDNALHPVTGLLAVHHLTTKRGKMGRPRLFESCTFEGCERPHRSRGLCRAHYSQQARGVPLTPIGSRPEVPETCTYEGCDRPHVGKGYCMTHYQQQRRGRALKPIATYTRSSN